MRMIVYWLILILTVGNLKNWENHLAQPISVIAMWRVSKSERRLNFFLQMLSDDLFTRIAFSTVGQFCKMSFLWEWADYKSRVEITFQVSVILSNWSVRGLLSYLNIFLISDEKDEWGDVWCSRSIISTDAVSTSSVCTLSKVIG